MRPDVALERKAERRADDLPRLRRGANGRNVEKAQRLLKEAGANLSVDGDFGPKTTEAVKRFQKSRGLKSSGVVDGKTWTALIKADLRRDFTFKTGQQDGAIKAAEGRLKRLGYDTGKVDGYMDASTSKAIKAFRADEKLGKNGLLTQAIRKELRAETKALDHAPLRRRIKDNRAARRVDAMTAKAAGRNGGIREGDKSKSVKNVQLNLKAAGFDPSRTDGRFDERTGGALKAFQRKSGLEPTGVVDGKTWKKLERSRMEADNATSPAQALNERSSAVKRSEKLLKKLGYRGVRVDGLFSKATEKAVKAFQKKNKLKASGRIGEGTLKKMKQVLRARSNPLGPTKSVTAYVNGSPRTIKVASVGAGEYLRADAAKAWLKMQAAAQRAGINIGATSGFRTMAEQQALWAQYGAPRAAPPGYSNHQNGIAMDVAGVGGRGTAADRWLLANSGRYGFRNLPSESWHYDYVG